jgi:hypothetical protein
MTTITISFSHRIARFCVLALLAAAPALYAEQTGYYRWKDDKGQFQATQQPPADRPSEYIKLSTGKSTQLAPGETVEGKENAAKSAQPGEKKIPGSMQAVPDKDPEKCKQAQQTQSVLDSHARIREKAENGEYRYLSPEEVAEQKKLASESVGVYCEEPAPK